jgi:hypothetical protein
MCLLTLCKSPGHGKCQANIERYFTCLNAFSPLISPSSKTIAMKAESQSSRPPAHCLVDTETQFYKYGFQVFHGYQTSWDTDLRKPFEGYLFCKLGKYMHLKKEYQHLEDYHAQFVDQESRLHHDFISKITRKVPEDVISPDCSFLKEVIAAAENLVRRKFVIYNRTIEFRVVRPGQPDNNLWHRDHWFPYFKPLVNVYIPLAGSFYDSVLKIVPGSHLWSDSDVEPTHEYGEGKRLGENGILYSTPTIKSVNKPLIEHRPDVLCNDFMLFSPMIIHGAGANNSNCTRFSLEIRLEYS